MRTYKQCLELYRKGVPIAKNFLVEIKNFVTRDIPGMGNPNGTFLVRENKKSDFMGVGLRNEFEERTGNFYLEIWGDHENRKKGWIENLSKAFYLCYLFHDTLNLYFMDMEELRDFVEANQCMWRAKEQRQCKQANRTLGYPVNIRYLMSKISIEVFNLKDLK